MTTRSIRIVGISDFGVDCIALTVPPSTAVLITRAEIAARIRAWVEMVFMFGPFVWFVAMDRTVGSDAKPRERLAMNCAKCVMNCKRVLSAKRALSAVHSRFLSFHRRCRRFSKNLALCEPRFTPRRTAGQAAAATR